MNIQELQNKVTQRNNPQWNKKRKKFKIKKTNNHKNEWKELYQGFRSAVDRDNT